MDHSEGEKVDNNMLDLTVIIGGAASGKSAYAEALALSGEGSPIYIATAQAYDTEMQSKIRLHKERRGPEWHTIEEPIALTEQLSALEPTGSVLVDCVTMWLSNIMIMDEDTDQACDRLCQNLPFFNGRLIIVTNEVGHGVVPPTKLGRAFQNKQGRLNQNLASLASRVILVTAGLPLALKGTLPLD